MKQLGLELPRALVPTAKHVMTVHVGELLFVSGHIARRNNVPWTGKLGQDVGLDDGKQAARHVVMDLLATMKEALGDLARVARVVKLTSFVNSAPDFTEQHLVTNAASELLEDVFGECSAHARSAIGVAQLPLGACVEIEAIVQVAPP